MEATAQHHTHDPIPSRWPIITAFGAGLIPVGLVSWSHGWKQGLGVLLLGLAVTILGSSKWWAELLRDRFFGSEAVHAESRLKTAMALFIMSEAAIFAAFFAALFYARYHAASWPPPGMPHFEILVPAVNTFILLFSSVTLHMGHTALERNRRDGMIASILMTIFLGAIFLCGQAYEYGVLNGGAFNVRSGIFGTTFFMLTGFHGLHVLMGLIFLNVVYGAALKGRITPEQHFPFRAASWYWHFVDVVWLFVFTIVYIL
jgi:heme/copper-type cytochrome/quinol oxidase subunit 3